MPVICRRAKVAAFTILELLIVATIFGGIMVVTSAIYFQSRDALQQSGDKIETSGRSRRTLDKLTQVVASAVEIGGFEALEVSDTTPTVLTDPCHLDVTTRENFLDPSYQSQQQFDTMGPYYRFRILFDPVAQELRMYSLKLVPVEIDTGVSPRLLGHNISGCRFEKVTVGSVGVTLETSAQNLDDARPEGVMKSTLHSVLVSPGSR